MKNPAHRRLYVDAVDAVPMSREVADAYAAALQDGWADPRRLYTEATRARQILDAAREEIAALLGTRVSHTHFTASRAVAAERIVMGVVAARRGRTRAVVSAAEPPAVMNASRRGSSDGITVVPLDRQGRIDVDEFARAALQPGVSFAAVSHANAETGALQPLESVYSAALYAKVPLVVDASATMGWLPPTKSWDALVVDPAAWGGPSGMGILALRPELRWLPAWSDGVPWAPGSTAIPAAVAAAAALRVRRALRESAIESMEAAARALRAKLAAIPDTIVYGDEGAQLPHIVAATFVYSDADTIARELDKRRIAVGTGCSCSEYHHTEGILGPTSAPRCPILTAMGAMTHGFVRFGLHEGIDLDAVAKVADAMPDAVVQSRLESAKAGVS